MKKEFSFWIDVVYTGVVISMCMILFWFLMMSVVVPLVAWVVF